MRIVRLKSLQVLLIIHAVVTLMAGIVLIVAPAFIPKQVDIDIKPDTYLLSYFLGAAELAIAYLSFCSVRIHDRYALRIICTAFIIFHAATGILEFYGLLSGVSTKIIGNIILRAAVIILFYYYGIYKNKIQ